MSDNSSSFTDNDLIATNTFHDWWISELRSSIAPTACDVEHERPEPESEDAEREAEPAPRRFQSRSKLLFACATGLFWGAAMIVLIDGGPETGTPTAQAATAAPPVRGIVEVGEIRVLNPPGEAEALPEFDRRAAARALEGAATEASDCASGRRGTARVMIHFQPNGSVEHARVVQGNVVGTPVASCIAERMRAVEVQPFSGKDVVVYKTIRLR